jgi:hypothetical protein
MTTPMDIDARPGAEPVPKGPLLGALADAVGHCVLVFAFLPALSALPGWLAFEATSRTNLEDGVVLAFLPVRGAVLLLHAFRAGVVTSVAAGIAAGLALTAWTWWRGAVASWGGRLGIGAIAGALAAGIGIAVGLAIVAARGTVPDVPLRVIAFELGTGIVCGMIAAPRAIQLLAREPHGRLAGC